LATGVYVLVRFVIIFLDIILLAMLVRAILSWFMMGDGESPIMSFLYVITEPLIIPVRLLCDHFGWFKGTPIDISFFLNTMALTLIIMLLSGLVP